jgi:hypothetical protein
MTVPCSFIQDILVEFVGKLDFSCAKKEKCLVFDSCEKNLWLGEKNIIPLPPSQQLNVLLEFIFSIYSNGG